MGTRAEMVTATAAKVTVVVNKVAVPQAMVADVGVDNAKVRMVEVITRADNRARVTVTDLTVAAGQILAVLSVAMMNSLMKTGRSLVQAKLVMDRVEHLRRISVQSQAIQRLVTARVRRGVP